MNLLHKLYLVEAEKFRILGQNLEAIDYYDRAITLAKEHEYVNEEAIAQELAAKFYLVWGKETIAQAYAINAYYAYARWGAKAKVNDIEKRYPHLLVPILHREKTSRGISGTISHLTTETLSSSSTYASQSLDLSSVLKASQAISGEIVFDKLLSTLMQVVIENAGAQKCVFILQKEGYLVIEVVAMSSPDEVRVLPSIPVESSKEICVSDMLNLLQLYQHKFTEPGQEIEQEIESIELEYLLEDLPNILSSMKEGAERICKISTSLKTFSRSDTSDKMAFNIHEGINSTLTILKYRLKANDKRPAIEIIKEYSDLPLVKCYPGQLNQVFMNIIIYLNIHSRLNP